MNGIIAFTTVYSNTFGTARCNYWIFTFSTEYWNIIRVIGTYVIITGITSKRRICSKICIDNGIITVTAINFGTGTTISYRIITVITGYGRINSIACIVYSICAVTTINYRICTIIINNIISTTTTN